MLTLPMTSIEDLDTTYECIVENRRGSENASLKLEGIFVNEVRLGKLCDYLHTTGLKISPGNSTLIIGESAVVNCTSTIVVEELLWLLDERVLVNASNASAATLMFNPVNDSIHNKTFICRAIQMGTAEKHITINVSGKTSFCCLCSLNWSMTIICSIIDLFCAHSSIWCGH
jgi:hypothetical protein